MDHHPGGSLKSQYQRKDRSSPRQANFSPNEAMRWARQLSSAIAYMHTLPSPVVHRDIKLENILLTSENKETADIKLSDFGLAVQYGNRKRFKPQEAQDRLKHGLRLGTPSTLQLCSLLAVHVHSPGASGTPSPAEAP